MSKPIVAIVGRPNVGKSTLFNTLAGERISIVKDTPGVTRDRIYADVSWLDYNFTMIDTGGIEPESKDVILSQMREQAEIAIAKANASKAANDAEVAAATEIAKKQNELAIKKSELQMEADTKKAMADAAYEIQREEQRKTIEITTANANIARKQIRSVCVPMICSTVRR